MNRVNLKIVSRSCFTELGCQIDVTNKAYTSSAHIPPRSVFSTWFCYSLHHRCRHLDDVCCGASFKLHPRESVILIHLRAIDSITVESPLLTPPL